MKTVSQIRSKGMLIRLAMLAPLLLISAIAIIDIMHEENVREMQQKLSLQNSKIMRGLPLTLDYSIESSGDEPRALIARALMFGRLAEQAPAGMHREYLLSNARAASDAAQNGRPLWAEALVTAAYIDSLNPDDSPQSAQAQTKFAKSYLAAPFLRRSGSWRISYGLAHWNSLDPQTQIAVVEEGVWLSGFNTDNEGPILNLFRNSPAYVQFMSRLYSVSVKPGHLQ